MNDLAALSAKLATAIASSDSQAAEEASEQIAKLVRKKKEEEQEIEHQKMVEIHQKKCRISAQKYPCVSCGGELEYAPYGPFSNRCKCSKCGYDCGRSPDLEEEEETQKFLQARIKGFKTLLRKALKIAKIRCNKDLSKINGKPFLVFNRSGYSGVLACKYDGNYNHERLGGQGGAEHWSKSLIDAFDAFICVAWSLRRTHDMDSVRQAIRALPLDEQYLRDSDEN